MSISITEDQHHLADAVRAFTKRAASVESTRASEKELAAGVRPRHWDELTRQGLHAIHLPADVGGQGGELADLAVVVEEAGRALLPGPFTPTVIASALVNLTTTRPERSQVAEKFASGATGAVVLPQSGLTVTKRDGGFVLDGESTPVLGLLSAEVIIVAARTEAEDVWLAIPPDTAGVARISEQGVDLTRDIGRLKADNVVLAEPTVLRGLDADRARYVQAALFSAEVSGVMRWCLGTAVEYSKVREQFGQPIGAFQAVKHKAANMLIDAELATAAAWDAIRASEADLTQVRLASAAAVLTAIGRAVDHAVETITLLGGIGVTWEHDAHLYWRRAISIAALIGPQEIWAIELGEAAQTTNRDFSLTIESVDQSFRDEISAVVAEASELSGAPTDEMPRTVTAAGRKLLADRGLVAPQYPKPYGIAATPAQQLAVRAEFERLGVEQPSLVIGDWALPTILAYGTEGQLDRFVLPTLQGEITWCQLFSEPGAGSDLAALSTTATRVEGGWILNGQKVWTSGAHESDWGICLARTDPSVPKHKGITYFLVDMKSEGIDIRPLRQTTGDAHFNEVFLENVHVPDDCVVGEPGQGWKLTVTTLNNERLALGGSDFSALDGVIRDVIRSGKSAVSTEAGQRALGLARAQASALRALNLRSLLRRLEGQQPDASSSLAKVAANRLIRGAAAAALDMAGPSAAVRSGRTDVVEYELQVPINLIGGGTIEIQLNGIADRVLGMPRG